MKDLVLAGYEVSAISSPGRDAAAVEAAGIRHIPVAISRKVSPVADLVALKRLWSVMRRERFDLVHTHTPKAGLLGQVAARLAKVPIVVNTVHGFYLHERMPWVGRRAYVWLERLAAVCSDAILSQNAEDIVIATAERIGRPDVFEHLGNGIDLARFDPSTVSDERKSALRHDLGIPKGPVVGFVGRLAGLRKGFWDFLAAARRIAIHRSDVRFLVVGSPDHGKPDAVHPGMAKDFGIEDRCIFAGSRPNHELNLYYAMMNVLVLPSLFEGVPRVIMEAAAMGVPSVVSDVKGNREAVCHGVSGLIVPLGDVGGLAGAILSILDNPGMARSMGDAGRKLAGERFDERRVFEKVRSTYAQLLRDRERGH